MTDVLWAHHRAKTPNLPNERRICRGNEGSVDSSAGSALFTA